MIPLRMVSPNPPEISRAMMKILSKLIAKIREGIRTRNPKAMAPRPFLLMLSPSPRKSKSPIPIPKKDVTSANRAKKEAA